MIDLYQIREWGAGYFDISENGDVIVTPLRDNKNISVSLPEIISGISDRGYDMPVLLRIEDILDSQMDSRFGRCKYFIFSYDKDGKPEIIKNKAEDAAHGAGIQASQLVIDKRPDLVITGHIGPNASTILMNAGIKVYSATGKTVREAIGSFNNGDLKELTGPNVQEHFGLNRGKNTQ